VLEQRLKKLCGKETTALKAWLTAQEDAHAKRGIQKHQPNSAFLCAFPNQTRQLKKREKLGKRRHIIV